MGSSSDITTIYFKGRREGIVEKSKAAGFALLVKKGDMKMSDVPARSAQAVRLFMSFEVGQLAALATGEPILVKNTTFMVQGSRLRKCYS